MSKFQTKPQVLVASVPIYGHVEKMQAIAADLVQRGYKVSFMTASIFRESVEKTGACFISLQGSADFQSLDLSKMWPDRELIAAGPEQMCFDLEKCFIDHMPEQYQIVQRFLATAATHGTGPVVMIQDTIFMGAMPMLLGAPGRKPAALISIGICPVTLSSIDTAPFNSGLPPDSSRQGRIRNIAMRENFRQMLDGPQIAWVEKLQQLNATETDGFFLDQLITLPDRYLQLCIKELEYPRSDAPDSLRYVGALPSGKREKIPMPSWWDIVVKHKKPLVVVSSGTSTNDPKDLIVPTLEALKGLDILVVATLVRSDNIEGYQIPANALTAKFIPFDELFKYADIIVSNGGYGTVQQAFSAGVPMVLAGMTEDHPESCARAAWTRAGINLATQTPEIAQLRKAVEEILGRSCYKARAMQLKAQYAKSDSLGDIAATVNELAYKAKKAYKLQKGKERHRYVGVPEDLGLAWY